MWWSGLVSIYMCNYIIMVITAQSISTTKFLWPQSQVLYGWISLCNRDSCVIYYSVWMCHYSFCSVRKNFRTLFYVFVCLFVVNELSHESFSWIVKKEKHSQSALVTSTTVPLNNYQIKYHRLVYVPYLAERYTGCSIYNVFTNLHWVYTFFTNLLSQEGLSWLSHLINLSLWLPYSQLLLYFIYSICSLFLFLVSFFFLLLQNIIIW